MPDTKPEEVPTGPIILPPPEAPPPAVSPTGTPVLPAKFTPYIFAAFLASGAVTTVAGVIDGVFPKAVLAIAMVTTITFGGLLGISPGWRKQP